MNAVTLNKGWQVKRDCWRRSAFGDHQRRGWTSGTIADFLMVNVACKSIRCQRSYTTPD